MSSHTQTTPAAAAEAGGSGARQAAFLRPLPGERRDGAAHGAESPEFAIGGDEILQKLFPLAETDDDHNASPSTAVGVRLGHFIIEERIGRGGMGGVFRAVDERLNRVVALKVLAPSSARDSAAVERFRNEGQAAARLDHENIARVYHIGDDHGVPFIAFEFVRGTNVRDVILQKGMLSPEEAVNYALQIAQALRHTHAARVVHRDIKPSNIIITPSGRAKLVDLGLARQEHSEPTRELTTPGTTLGTFDYIAPEQARDPRCVDVRTDIYSLGCTLYHMLTGQPPFPQGTIIQKVVDHHLDAPPDPAVRNPLAPPELSQIVRTMMASNPDDRYAGPDELIGDLSEVAASLGLRPSHADNLVWTRPPYERQPGFFEANKGWLLMLSILLLIAAVVHRMPPIVPTSIGTDEISDGSANPESPLQAPAAPSSDSGGSTPALAVTAPPEPEEVSGMLSGLSAWRLPAGSSNALRRATVQAARPPDVMESFDDSRSESATRARIDADAVVRNIEQLNSPVPGGNTRPTGSRMDSSTSLSHPFVLLDGRDHTEQPFATLDAACRAAPRSGVIELRFDGRLRTPQPPVQVREKRLTIRAQQDRRPIIEFESPVDQPQWSATRMFQVSGGSLVLQDVTLLMPVRSGRYERWALFSLVHAQQLRLERVSIVVANPDRQTAAVVEFALPPGDDADAMMPGSMQREPVELHWQDCLVRAECDLIASQTLDPADVRLDNVAVGLRGCLARIDGQSLSNGRVNEDRRLSVTLQQVTALLNDGLIRVDTGNTDREFPPLNVECDHTALIVRPDQPLVVMRGPQQVSTLKGRLRWLSHVSIVDATEPVWEIIQLPEAFPNPYMIDQLYYGDQQVIETDVLMQRMQWDQARFASLPKSAFKLRRPLGSSARTEATGVQFGERMPAFDALAANHAIDDRPASP